MSPLRERVIVKFLTFKTWRTLMCKSPFQLKISFMNQSVDPVEFCKETMFCMIISSFPGVILWLLFAFFGILYHRNLFNRKTENAHGYFTCRGVTRVLFLQTELLKQKNCV